MEYIFNKFLSIWDYLILKGGIVLSALLTGFLTIIGYPKQVIIFIIILMIGDVLSRWIAEVVKAYGHFTFYNFFKAWKDKVLNSKKLKSGLYIKVFFYTVFMVIAHQTSIVPELAFGNVISSFLYSILIVLDCISIGENFIDAGFTKAQFIIDYFNKKKNALMDIKESDVKVVKENNTKEVQNKANDTVTTKSNNQTPQI